jgi:hypothetical protein
MNTSPSSDSSYRFWSPWAALLVVLYVLVGVLGWHRTLIGNEVWALYYTGRPLGEQIQAIRSDLVHPPLIYLVERAWLAVFGHTDRAAKALALLINIPTIVLFTWFASKVTRYWKLAAFLFTSIYLEVGSSPTQIRMYGLGLLLTVIGMVFWEKWRERPTMLWLAAWTLTMVLLVYTHLFGALIVMAFVIVDWIYGPRRVAFTAAAVLVSLAMVPWVIYVLPVLHTRGLEPNVAWVSRSPLRGVAELPLIFMGTPPLPVPRTYLALAGIALNLLLFVLAWRAFPRLWPPRSNTPPAERWFWMALVLAGLPILILFLFSLAITPAFHPRFILGVLPSYWLLLVLLGELGGRVPRAVLYAIFIPWVLISAGGNLVQQRKPSTVRQAAFILFQDALPDDLILCNGAGNGNTLDWEWKHWLRRTTPLEIVAVPSVGDEFTGPPKIRLEALDLNAVNRVWVFYDKADQSAISPTQLSDFLAANRFSLARQSPADKPFVFLYVKIPSP